MKRFAQLFLELESKTKTNAKLEALAQMLDGWVRDKPNQVATSQR